MFFNTGRDVFAWVNQEDHVRIFAQDVAGTDKPPISIKRTFARLSDLYIHAGD